MALLPLGPGDKAMLEIAKRLPQAIRDGKSILDVSREVLGAGKEITAEIYKQWARTALTGSQVTTAEATEIAQGIRAVNQGQSALSAATNWVRNLWRGGGAGGAAAEGGMVSSTLTGLGETLTGGALSGTAALAAGAVAATVVLGGLTYGLANLAGSHSGDKPVQLGPAANQPRAPAVTGPQSGGAGPFFIYILDMYGGYVFVGDEASVKRGSCNFPTGGPPPCPDAPHVTVLGTLGDAKGYFTKDQAVTAYCGSREVTSGGSSLFPSRGTVFGKASLDLDGAPPCS